ncbi:MAG: tetratricopeptide repeat protein [Alphaproteobacteria bacterium]|nr:tetratricopeptide repeat protein [Alphaproteobacteria bacterium]MDD9920133.1 tetratricopeptide repeat protein [Alphaproteobacteria bacterium]
MYAVRKPKQKPVEQEPQDNATQAFLREVDDALHEENMNRLWKQWRMPLFAALAALFIGVGGWHYWGEYQDAKRQAAADALFTLGQSSSSEDSLAVIEQSGLVGPFILANFQQARAAQEAGEHEKAIALYEKVANSSNIPVDLKDLAIFYSAVIQADVAPGIAEEKLAALDAKESTFRPSALELQARLSESKGDKATALALWEKLTVIPNVPPSLAQRAYERAEDLKALVQK